MQLHVVKRDGRREPLDISKIHAHTGFASDGLPNVSQSELELAAQIQLFDGISTSDIHRSLVTAAADLVQPGQYENTFAAARLTLLEVFKDVTGGPIQYPHLKDTITKGVEGKHLRPDLLEHFDFEALDKAINPERDFKFTYIGMRTLFDRYFGKLNGVTYELPQHYFMRVAMGIALAEKPEDRTRWAIEFYDVMSSLLYMPSTPSLFNAGTLFPQLSSCFVLTMDDSLESIFATLKEAATYSKFSGGIGMDLTYVRPAGSRVSSTNGKAGGIAPYAKMYNDTLNAFDQGGKRKGAGAVYLQPWHADILTFLDLRKTSTDERIRTDDLFPALWIPDLFMERMREDMEWSLFDSHQCRDLVYLYGPAFKERYEYYERNGYAVSKMPAKTLWKRIIDRLFETGVNWPCFKDNVNLRNMQKDTGVVHSSNLCTEIVLNNDPTDVGQSVVCNLGSINLAAHTSVKAMVPTIRTAMRMLDNVVMIGLIPHEKGRRFNEKDRAVGFGMMGLAEYVAREGIHYESQEFLEENNRLLNFISYHVYDSAADLAAERGSYPNFEKSEWAKGILPYDTANANAKGLVSGDTRYPEHLDQALREKIRRGFRFAACMAIAPTATIADICGTTSCVEPVKDHFTLRGNLSGNFNRVNQQLNYHNGAYAVSARTIDQEWLIKAAAVRQIYIDQSQSTNLWIPRNREIKGKTLSAWYTLAWLLGLKTTYYLYPLSSDTSDNKVADKVAEDIKAAQAEKEAQRVCSIENGPNCEACQ